MHTYQKTQSGVLRDDGIHIPQDISNGHWQQFIREAIAKKLISTASALDNKMPIVDGKFLKD